MNVIHFQSDSNDAAPTESTQGEQARHRMPRWSEEEDRTLLSTYQNCRKDVQVVVDIDLEDDGIWEHVSSIMPSRTAVQCLLRYMKLTAAKRIPEIDCVAAMDENNKRDYDDLKLSPSTASTCSASGSSGNSRKKLKHDESYDDWTEEETERLEQIMLEYGDNSKYRPKEYILDITSFHFLATDSYISCSNNTSTATTPDWDAIARHFEGKCPIDCLTQWQNISLPDQVKGKGSWTPTEDTILREKRAAFGRKWSKIAEYLPGRSGKQCRERYINHLNPNLKRGEWTGKGRY